jgi:hypothetical protein
MKTLLYIGNLRQGGNGQDRKRIFEGYGFNVLEFDIRPYKDQKNRLLRAIGGRFHFGPAVSRMNRDIIWLSEQHNIDAIFVDKGTWVYPGTLRKLKNNTNAGGVIHFTPDPQFLSNRSRHFFKSIPYYDLLVTTKSYEMELYKKVVKTELLFIHQGYGERIRVAEVDLPEKTHDVVFIGHFEPHYGEHIRCASQVADVAVWGSGWHKQSSLGNIGNARFMGDGIYGEEYGITLGASKIALGLLSKSALDRNTTRSFEIPASGALLLAERTDEHSQLYQEGKEAAFFSSPEEMCEKIMFYLSNNSRRDSVSAAGRQRCISSGYSSKTQFRLVIDWLNNNI